MLIQILSCAGLLTHSGRSVRGSGARAAGVFPVAQRAMQGACGAARTATVLSAVLLLHHRRRGVARTAQRLFGPPARVQRGPSPRLRARPRKRPRRAETAAAPGCRTPSSASPAGPTARPGALSRRRTRRRPFRLCARVGRNRLPATHLPPCARVPFAPRPSRSQDCADGPGRCRQDRHGPAVYDGRLQ
jgi:hypothetical protein